MSEDVGNFDTALELCCDQHRRIVLAIIIKEQRPLSLNDLSKSIVRHNHHLTITEVPAEEVTQIYLSLYHIHIPKLVANGVLEYDRERQLVQPTERLEQLEPYLATIIDADPGLNILVNK
ncbi:DUF7344 domain-containing protein [Natronorubrum aibiense]|uniref:DUF7344 domain-containing protein n=1 Tax=Natronorubrum aibiense TaxID=348826 RepID=A0A5P9P9S6_9EURY|nr:hypothetical protein [Natronorubrum aibiense]QFU84757.1 hypothetical protein GCU68_19780 [Natronorubrum aibiense]